MNDIIYFLAFGLFAYYYLQSKNNSSSFDWSKGWAQMDAVYVAAAKDVTAKTAGVSANDVTVTFNDVAGTKMDASDLLVKYNTSAASKNYQVWFDYSTKKITIYYEDPAVVMI